MATCENLLKTFDDLEIFLKKHLMNKGHYFHSVLKWTNTTSENLSKFSWKTFYVKS